MKKKLIQILSLTALALLLLPLAITFGQTGNTLTWDYDISAGFGVGFIVDPLCSAARPDVCVTGFDLAYTVGTGAPVIAARVPVSACALQAGSTVLYSCTAPIPAIQRYGSLTWTVRAVAKDATAEISSIESNSVSKPRQPAGCFNARTP